MFNVTQNTANPLHKPQAKAIALPVQRQNVGVSIPSVSVRDILSYNFFVSVVVVFLLVKVAFLQAYGIDGYSARVEMFLDGNFAQQIAGRLLALDPFSVFVSKMLGGV